MAIVLRGYGCRYRLPRRRRRRRRRRWRRTTHRKRGAAPLRRAADAGTCANAVRPGADRNARARVVS